MLFSVATLSCTCTCTHKPLAFSVVYSVYNPQTVILLYLLNNYKNYSSFSHTLMGVPYLAVFPISYCSFCASSYIVIVLSDSQIFIGHPIRTVGSKWGMTSLSGLAHT